MAIKHHINDLPDCVLLKIFKQLPCKGSIWRARNVCTRWYGILVDAELWRVSNLSPFKLDDVSILDHIRSSLSLQVIVYLEVYSKTFNTQVLATILNTASHLRGLRVNGCTMRGEVGLPRDSGPVGPVSIDLPKLKLNFLDFTNTRGSFSFMSTLLPLSCCKINVLGLSNSFQPDYQTIREQPFLSYLGNLQMFECKDCVWVNDSIITSLAHHCPLLQSLNATNCVNIQGNSLHTLLTKCPNLTTLILRKTGIRGDAEVQNSIPWSHLNLTELDVSCCYKMDEEFVNTLLSTLAPKLRYLRCAVNDEIIQNIKEIKKPLRTLELRRMHAVDMTEITKFLSTCECLEALDVSSAPMEYEDFKALLSNLPQLRWLSIAGHDVGKQTFDLISQHNPYIRAISVNFYQSRMKDVDALRDLIANCPGLRKICLQGPYVKSVARDIQKDLDAGDCMQSVNFCKSSDFSFPSPQLSIQTFAEKFAEQSSGLSDFFARDTREGNLL